MVEPPVNGHAIGTEPDDETRLRRVVEEASQRLEQLQAEKNRQTELLLQQKGEERIKLLKTAKIFRQQSLEIDDKEEAELRLQWADEAETKAAQLAQELGINGTETAVAADDQRPWLIRNYRKVLTLQAISILTMIWMACETFLQYREKIIDANKTLPLEQQMQPFDWTSLQKFFFEKFVQFSDLPVALVTLFLVAPFVARYILLGFHTEFSEKLTPWQRCVISTAFVLGFLLLASLAHMVKP